MNSNWTGRFPRTTAEALGCDGHAIYLYKPPLHRRFFYALCRHGWVLFVVALAVLVLSGCSVDNSAEWPESDNLQAIQQEESAKASREFAGQEVCGPGALAQWVDDKTLTCTPRRGQTYTVAGGTK